MTVYTSTTSATTGPVTTNSASSGPVTMSSSAPANKPAAPPGSTGENQQPTQTRLLFPETWLWTDLEITGYSNISE